MNYITAIVTVSPKKICANEEKFAFTKTKNGSSFLLKSLQAPMKENSTVTKV
jgi:hypothetical protein